MFKLYDDPLKFCVSLKSPIKIFAPDLQNPLCPAVSRSETVDLRDFH